MNSLNEFLWGARTDFHGIWELSKYRGIEHLSNGKRWVGFVIHVLHSNCYVTGITHQSISWKKLHTQIVWDVWWRCSLDKRNRFYPSHKLSLSQGHDIFKNSSANLKPPGVIDMEVVSTVTMSSSQKRFTLKLTSWPILVISSFFFFAFAFALSNQYLCYILSRLMSDAEKKFINLFKKGPLMKIRKKKREKWTTIKIGGFRK